MHALELLPVVSVIAFSHFTSIPETAKASWQVEVIQEHWGHVIQDIGQLLTSTLTFSFWVL